MIITKICETKKKKKVKFIAEINCWLKKGMEVNNRFYIINKNPNKYQIHKRFVIACISDGLLVQNRFTHQ